MHPAIRLTLYLTVFATGAAGLIYQVVWQQYLGRLIGNEHAATAVILAVFLGGLAAGYLLSGVLSARARNSLYVYAVLEAIIGVWALLFPFLFHGVDSLTASWSFRAPGLLLGQGAVVALLLMLPPTLCMGGTVPLLTRAISESVEHATRVHARVYAVNTLGAFAGALAAGFALIPWLGLPGSLQAGAILNLAAAGFFFLLGRRRRVDPVAPALAEQMTVSTRRYPVPVLLVVAFLSGAYVMTLENVLIRVTDLALGPSTYSFAIIVGVFVLCIGIGSLIVGARRELSPNALIWNQALLALSLLALFLTLDKWPYFAHVVRVGFASNIAGFWWHKIAVLCLLTLLLAIPVCLAGATLPIAFHELRRRLERVGWHSGLLFFWNLTGAVVGSLVGGWLLYIWLGNGRIFLVAALLCAVSATVAAWPRGLRPLAFAVLPVVLAAIMLITVPAYTPTRFAVGTSRLIQPTAVTWQGPTAFHRARTQSFQIIHYLEGPAASVAVTESPVTEKEPRPGESPALIPSKVPETTRAIFTNGKPDSSAYSDRETLRLLADLAALFASNRERVLIVGLGTGVTAGEVALYSDYKKIVVAEVLPEAVKTLPLFAEATHNVERDPRLEIRLGDAFRVLRRSPEKWDAVISEPSHLWARGTGQLFSREFYSIVKQNLREGGVFVQWMQLYGVTPEILARVGSTLRSEFEHVTAFKGTQSDMLFLATAEPLGEQHFQRANQVLANNPRAAESLREIGINTAEDLNKRRGEMRILRQIHPALIESLDQPQLHYLAGRSAFSSEMSGEIPFVPKGPVEIKSRKLLEMEKAAAEKKEKAEALSP